ncbi:MAG: hypothetical protein ACR2NF_00390 [Pirellulales bacterium]
MTFLDKKAILAAKDETIVSLDVPEWGGEIGLRAMTVGERDQYENEFMAAKAKDKGVENFRTKFLVACICDEDGKPVFDRSDINALSKKSIQVVNRVWNAAMSHNALSNEDVEELAKE